MITLLIVDDHFIVRQGLKSMLAADHPDWEIVEADNGVQAILVASRVKPDLILMDYLMPKLDGIKAASVISRDLPGCRILMITMTNREDLLPAAIRAGIKLIISKDASDGEISETISEYTSNISTIPVEKHLKAQKQKPVPRKEKDDKHSSSLFFTDRELEVMGFMMKGHTTTWIADYLGISKRTVEGHKSKIMKKCNVHSYQELFRFVMNNKILLFS